MTALGMRVASFAATCRAPATPRWTPRREALDAWDAREIAAWDLERRSDDTTDASPRSDTPSAPQRAPPPIARCLVPRPPFAPRVEVGARARAREEVVATLDYHVGARLPGELLEGAFPRGPGGERAEDRREAFDPFADEKGVESGILSPAVAAAATFAPLLGGDAESAETPRENAAENASAASSAASSSSASSSSSTATVASGVSAALAMGLDGIDPETAASAMDSMPSAFPRTAARVRGRRRVGRSAGVRLQRVRRAAPPPRGLAGRILRAAHRSARDQGVEVMYCHVERGNEGARRLYEKEGYAKEAEESAWVAERLGRPPRILLRKNLLGPEEP